MAALVPADGGPGGSKTPWCEREELLASMYNFTHRSCSSLQDEQYVRGFIGILQHFVKSLTVGPMAGRGCDWACGMQVPAHEKAASGRLAGTLSSTAMPVQVTMGASANPHLCRPRRLGFLMVPKTCGHCTRLRLL